MVPDSSAVLLIEDRDRVRVLTLDRPDRLNAFDTPLYHAVTDALGEAGDDHDVACVVVTGAGRAFSSGQDLGEMSAIDQGSPGAAEHGFRPFMDALSRFSKPLLAAVNGIGLGVGCTMLLHCDVVVLADDARLRVPFTSLGVVPEAASSYLMPRTMGSQAASLALYTSRWIDADEAVRWGLALRAVPAGSLLDETLAIAREIARMPTAALVETKRLVLAARDDAVQAARAREDEAFQRMLLGPANVEALQAFFEGREPDFTSLPPPGPDGR